MLLCIHCSGDYSKFRRSPCWALTDKQRVNWWWKNNVIFSLIKPSPESVSYPSNSTLEKGSVRLITPLDDNSVCFRHRDYSSSSSRFEWKCHLEEQSAVSSCTPRAPVETTVSLSTFSPQTATIICLKNSFSLAIDISAVSLNPLRNGLLRSLVD